MPDEDPNKLADQLEDEADKLAAEGDRLEGRAQEVRQDWQRKRADPGVPGANPDAEEPPEKEEPSENKSAD
jgi:hypothetical protein